MPRIRILPDHVANQIAAGEVVERPVAVVKELVENALDAGASRVEVTFNHGGKSLIRVEDNGFGMSEDEAILALERHATSKIATAEDLNTVRSFGFRGEALPSIASVSRFTLRSRREQDEAGTEILVNSGKILHRKACGMSVGTVVEVAHLFNSVPARRKFLKTDRTEAAHIVQCVRLFALAHPQVAFRLVEDGREVMRSPACRELIERIGEAWSRSVADVLMPLAQQQEAGVGLSGALMRPGHGRSSRNDMQCFVNGRAVESRTLTYAILESYHTHMPRGRYPAAFLFIEIDPASIDVNVHPAKREIRFRNEGEVRRLLVRALGGALGEGHLNAHEPEVASLPVFHVGKETEASSPEVIPSLPRPQASSPGGKQMPRTSRPEQPLGESAARAVTETPPAAVAGASLPRLDWRFLGLLHQPRRLALFESSKGLVLLHSRAAHERIHYERLCSQFAAGELSTQPLLVPLSLDLDPVSASALEPAREALAELGVVLEPFGRQFYRVTALPSWFEPEAGERFVRDLVDGLRQGRVRLSGQHLAHEPLALLAATRALRVDDALGAESALLLARQLMACAHPLTCPRGRPTLQEISAGELTKKFGLSSSG